VNILPDPNQATPVPQGEMADESGLPDFLLSAVQPCRVKLTPLPSEQTPPTKTKAELLADGQCEV